MKTYLFFFVFLSFALFTRSALAFKPIPDKAPQEKLAQCTVDGHGPYDLSYTKCMQLGSDQAHTNCVLNEKDSQVEVLFVTSTNKKTSHCTAKLKADSEDCLEAKCTAGKEAAL